MYQLLSLGAINKHTGEYIYPKIANKKDEYICPECNKDLILCQGEIRIHHFRHKVDSVNPCHHYSNPSETQLHKDAKILLKHLLERKNPISFIRNCCCCKKNEEFEIPEISENSVIKLEYRFEYNGIKIADVAYIDDDELLCIFEICNTHKTCSENRPEPWFEIKAETLIKIANDNSLTSLLIPCIRCEKCEVCIETENTNLKDNNIEKYVRVKLGQQIFPTPIEKNCENIFTKKDCECDKCKYNEWYDKEWKKKGHLRINFHAEYNITNNKKIMELFNEDFIDKKIVIHSHKGGIDAYIISKLSYNKYDYWNYDNMNNNMYPYEKIIDMNGKSTVEIIIELIRYCKNVSFIKKEKIKTIKNNIIKVDNNRKQQREKEIDNDDDADAFRSMRYSKQYSNHKMSLTQELIFIENDVNYTLGNNVIVIEHQLTHTKVKRSLVNNKTFYKGKWRTDISVKLIINWYSSNYDLLDEL
jgi:competence CoiA-like predicted nuclease